MSDKDYNIIDAALDAASGKLELADKETVEKRRNICNGCEANVAEICTACGCIIPAKIRLAKSSCPMELW